MNASDSSSELALPLPPTSHTPRHGFQGDRARSPKTALVPPALTVAISREAGSRGTTIARRAAKLLGWNLYDQEILEYVSQEVAFRQRIADSTTPEAAAWLHDRLQALWNDENLSQHPAISEQARLVLALGAQGEVILVGRGAGCILPPASTLNVRIVSPLADRVAYMSQWLRLTMEEAEVQVATRDRRRAEFIQKHFHRRPGDVHQYDLHLNSSLLGEELCAELIAQAALAKGGARTRKHEARDS
jgi:cytidylate kinase